MEQIKHKFWYISAHLSLIAQPWLPGKNVRRWFWFKVILPCLMRAKLSSYAEMLVMEQSEVLLEEMEFEHVWKGR